MTRKLRVLVVVMALVISFPSPTAAADPNAAGRTPPSGGQTSTPVGPDIATLAHDTFQPGDVFVGANGGKVEWRLPDGTLNKVLDTGASTSETTGMAFDFAGDLYVTAFQANQIYKFDNHGELVGPWGGGFNSDPESIVFNAAGIAYVGQADGSRQVLSFRPDGSLIESFVVQTERRGSDWLDLASDQCTLRYTSEGSQIKQFDVCTRTQLADWGTLPALPNTAYALRMIGDDTTLVADWNDIRWLDASGATIRVFDAPSEDAWFALNLDPDGRSFWSADYFTGMVYRFDLTTGQVLTTFQSTSGQTSGLAVYGEFRAGAVRSCAAEDLSGDFGRIDPNTANDERVTVVYDGRILAQQDAAAVALAMAEKVKERAEATLREDRDRLGLPIPDAVRIEIRCAAGIPPFFERDGYTGEPGVVQLKADMVRNELAAAALADFPPYGQSGGEWNKPGAYWKNTIGHELFHTIQYLATDLRVEWGLGNHTQTESTAVAGQDLIADVDGIAETLSSYLESVRAFAQLRPHASLQGGGLPSDDSYRAPSVLQYWGERYGSQDEPNLERRVARFLYTLMGAPTSTQEEDFGATIGYDWSAASYGDADIVAALRDYYLAHYALRASNVSVSENPAYAILDAEAGQAYEPFNMNGRQLQLALGENTYSLPLSSNLSGDVYELTFPAGTTQIDLTLDSSAFGQFSTALVPVQPNETFVLDPDLMFSGPAFLSPVHKTVQVIGADRLALVFVRALGPIWGANLELKATPIRGQPAVEVLPPLTQQLRTSTSGPIVLNIRPTIDGQPVTGDLPRSVFGVKVGSSNAFVGTVDFRGDSYHIEAWAPSSLGSGTYSLTLTFVQQDFAAGDLVIGQAAPPHREFAALGSLGELGQGQSATASAAVTPGAAASSFSITWAGSTFDLTLTSPTGRIIPSSSTDPDVTVSRTATSVDITVSGPESGEWHLQATGIDVPLPEAVSYEVTEDDAPLAGSLAVTNQGQAGLPLEAHFAFSEPGASVTGATVIAAVTDPSGTVRHFDLRDDGASHDASAGDGVYGGQLWATDLAGSYRIDVTANGKTLGGAAVQRAGSASVTLGPKVDTDGDGVADAAEVLVGLDPADPTDGAADNDGDGLTLAEELTAGSDPGSWDGDGGGESDRSELAAGREPTLAADDASVEEPGLGARAIDGALVSVTVATASGGGSVHVYRLTQTSSTDLGSFPGSGTTFDDGPLPAGQYGYLAVAVSPSGAESAPISVGPINVADDVTPPMARIILNQGNWNVSVLSVPVTFTDLSEPVTDMRLALSEDDLAAAAWVPFAPFTSVSLPPTLGQHFVYAQVRDQAGNESPVASSFVFLVDTTPPSSVAGPLDPQYTTTSVDVPFTVSDDLSGVASIELWSRFRVTSTDPWGAWMLGPTGPSSPIRYTFGSDGLYEFYTIGIDAAGNREAAPALADAATQKTSALTGTGKTWGSNSQGQLGNGTTANSSSPIDVSSLTGITSLGAGAEHSLAAKSDGTAWAWGQNANGELGDGTTSDRLTPIQVSGIAGATAVAGGTAHSLILKSDGIVWAFGLNQNGQLGDGTTTQRTTPVQVTGLSGVIAVAAGSDHSLALKSDGTVWAWGKNTNGQLGDGTKQKRTTPVRTGTLTGIVAIAAGGDHSLAVKSDGTVWAWGDNFYGQLGDGTKTNRTSPVRVTGLTGAVGVAAGSNHSLAIKSDGTVWAWGNNGVGQLGDGTTTSRTTAVRSGTLSGVIGLAAGAHHSLGLKSDGSLWAWGYNLYGQVGDGTTTTRTSAVQVAGLSSIAAIAGGAFFSLAATGGG